MSKPKHKTVIKWVVSDEPTYRGDGGFENRMTLVEAKFVQTDKRLTLVKSDCKGYRDAARAIGYRTYVPVDSGMVFDTPMAALNAAVAEYQRQVGYAENRLKAAKDDLARAETLRLGWEIDLKLSS